MRDMLKLSGGVVFWLFGTVPALSSPATPVSITVTPPVVSLPDNTLSGAVVASISITTSGGSPFSGTLAITPPGFLMISNQTVVVSRNLTPRDDGTRELTITATQNGKTLSATLTVQVTMRFRELPPQP